MIKKIINYIKDPYLKITYYENQVNVLNYDKVLEIKDDIIRIIKSNKIIFIYGIDLKLNKLLDNELLITGEIKKIEM